LGQENGKDTHLAKGLVSVLNLTQSPQSPTQIPNEFQDTTLQFSFRFIPQNHQTADSTQPHTFKRCRRQHINKNTVIADVPQRQAILIFQTVFHYETFINT
jgi:hypothetical protein